MSAQVLDDLLWRRHSCRAFLPDPVPRAAIRTDRADLDAFVSFHGNDPCVP
ncbi:hypothetical protein SAMN05444007_105327 [Cribrihabitans marinus]|uniref:Uncharacterized protein n=1 Tax=Cribrihabitans marinus TaxID=1227549 RepID=A0A1H7A1A5_9RHOB|nr:hypothetical protein [Cribrihabitans marinus]GGH29604.1 hypothetical protein GCM10010973_19160 [Cribrihabitans marinus]SEJ59381.1 hypothetical protein SAMN05444007_105327 [Cribrihabitans marinus]